MIGFVIFFIFFSGVTHLPFILQIIEGKAWRTAASFTVPDKILSRPNINRNASV